LLASGARRKLSTATASAADLRAELRDASAEQLAAGGPFALLTLELWLYAARDATAGDALRGTLPADAQPLGRGACRARRRSRDQRIDAAARRGRPGRRARRRTVLQHLIDPDAITPELRANALAAR
jgi:hypothetical protein